jgi:hypothetical protein
LTDTEADEVVQETAIAIARHLPEYRYDRELGIRQGQSGFGLTGTPERRT